jgi:hypothetical protein
MPAGSNWGALKPSSMLLGARVRCGDGSELGVTLWWPRACYAGMRVAGRSPRPLCWTTTSKRSRRYALQARAATRDRSLHCGEGVSHQVALRHARAAVDAKAATFAVHG